jgi:hypothetical protein
MICIVWARAEHKLKRWNHWMPSYHLVLYLPVLRAPLTRRRVALDHHYERLRSHAVRARSNASMGSVATPSTRSILT